MFYIFEGFRDCSQRIPLRASIMSAYRLSLLLIRAEVGSSNTHVREVDAEDTDCNSWRYLGSVR